MGKIKLPYKLILASTSPRRQQLMTEAGYTFEIMPSHIPEDIDPKWAIEDIPVKLAYQKANDVRSKINNDDTLIIGADTIVVHQGEQLGKPSSRSEAVSMLKRLSNDEHTVITGVCFAGVHNLTFSDTSVVKMDKLTDKEIEFYIQHFNPMDKAGAYGIQEWIGHNKILSFKGSYTNVMGLPMQRIYAALCLFEGSIIQ